MKQYDELLKHMLGESGFAKLAKSIYRRDSHSTLSPIDMYLPMIAVPRAMLSWLTQNVQSIPIGETRSIRIPTMPNTEIVIEKKGRDAYSARFVEEGKVIHTFENQTLPGVGGHLMSVGEMYHDDMASSGQLDLPISVLRSSGVNTGDIPDSVMTVMAPLIEMLGKVIDALVSKQILRNVIQESQDGVTKAAIPMANKPSGQAGPAQPYASMDPAQPSKNPQKEIKENKELIDNKVSPPTRTKSSADYFRRKLRGTHFEKTEGGCLVSEDLLYTPCHHCGVAEFRKTEKGPKYQPCACFKVTLDPKEPKRFVSVKKNQDTGLYVLEFNKSSDKQLLAAFLLTLQDKLEEYQS